MNKRLMILATAFALSAFWGQAFGAVNTYDNRPAYLAAATPLGSTTNIDFSTYDSGLNITIPGSDVYIDPLNLRDVTFAAQSYYNDVIYTFPNATYPVRFPVQTYAFGMDLRTFYGTAGTFTVTLSTGDVYSIPYTPSGSMFFGAISDVPVQWATIYFDNDYHIMDNFTFTRTNADNCPTTHNPNQIDTDNDNIGDACDSDGLVSHWKFEQSPFDGYDGNHGAAMGSIGYSFGYSSHSLALNGHSGGWVEVPDSPSLSPTGQITLAAWVRLNQNNIQQAFIEKYDVPGRNGYLLRLDQTGKLNGTICNPSTCSQPNAVGVTTVSTGVWHHVAMVYDGAFIKVFLDGALDSSVPTTFSLTDGPMSLKLGARGDDANTRLNGRIDEAKIFNRALTDDEIAGLADVVFDSIAPTTAASLNPAGNVFGWNNSDVSVSLSSLDNADGSGLRDITYSASGAEIIPATSVSGASANLLITAEGETTIGYFATDNAGNMETVQTLIIRIDKSPPSVSCGSADGVWHADDVSITCTANDAIAGLADSSDSNFNLTTDVVANTETANALTDSRTICDVAENCSLAGPVGGHKVDKKAPTITIHTPSPDAVYLLNASVFANYTCTDGGSGVSSCTGSVSNGSNLDTASVGAKSFTVNASDNVGNNASPSVLNYTVAFAIDVLFDQTKSHKSGSTVPIKIRLLDANGANVSSTPVHAVSVVQTGSEASPLIDDSGNANPDLDFRYDATLGGYIFNLKTTGYGTGSYVLNFIAGASSTVYSVSFQIRQ